MLDYQHDIAKMSDLQGQVTQVKRKQLTLSRQTKKVAVSLKEVMFSLLSTYSGMKKLDLVYVTGQI